MFRVRLTSDLALPVGIGCGIVSGLVVLAKYESWDRSGFKHGWEPGWEKARSECVDRVEGCIHEIKNKANDVMKNFRNSAAAADDDLPHENKLAWDETFQ